MVSNRALFRSMFHQILSDGMAFYLAVGGYFPIGQAFGSRLETVGAVYAF